MNALIGLSVIFLNSSAISRAASTLSVVSTIMAPSGATMSIELASA